VAIQGGQATSGKANIIVGESKVSLICFETLSNIKHGFKILIK